ncbi:PAS domain-containing hybrid sensor histidine kinase/response regulator [Anaeromyxobacter paludicola]|uniref:PAS domain-containing hybrid sensor histidine kinase/response regulator n=1 Tax=Anaeromyxobacter paludicola TaxID=2918171 RepID=UPI0020BE042D|nr:PAS domain-containing protein [Anaeromyxobacter paludicola]
MPGHDTISPRSRREADAAPAPERPGGAAPEAVDSGSLLRAISDSSDDVIYAKDRAGRLRFANPATLALIGKPLEAALGKTDAELLDDAEAARRVMENDRRIMETGATEELLEEVPLPDGTRRLWLSQKRPWRDASGRIVGLFGISRDVTARKQDEEALRESEARYRSLFANMTEGFTLGETILDERGVPVDFRLLEVNEAFERQSGLSRERALAGTIREVLPQIEQSWIDTYGRVALTGQPVRFRMYNRDLDRHFNVSCYCPSPGRFAVLFSDETERVRAEEALREADRRKDHFLGVLSHELRNPLAPIRNSVFLLRRAPPGGEQSRRAVDVIGRQVEHLTRLVDDLLDVSRIVHGKVSLRRERLDLVEVARRSAEDLRAVFEERGLALEVRLPAEPLWMHADPTRLAQLVGNLLQNAAKFTPAGGRVGLTVTGGAQQAALAVSDTGVGIAPELLGRVFEPFVQAEEALAQGRAGLGLGLALVKGLAELHGGTASASSEGPGRGSTFRVELPLEPPGEAGARSREASQVRALLGRRVLVVDDNVDAAESLAELLVLFGHQVEVAFDGPSAIEKARARPPEAVLCDLGLPGMSGYEVARALRRECGDRTRLIALSGYAQPGDLQRSAEAGFDAHLSKPADPADIERLLA